MKLLKKLREDRRIAADDLRAITAKAVAEKRGLTEDENREREELRSWITQLDERIDELVEQEKRDQATADHHVAYGGATVTSEARTYRADLDKSGERSFFADAFRSMHLGDMGALERQQRHAREAEVDGELSKRATSTSSFAGLIVPQYLVEDAALVARAGRAFANSLGSRELPAEGMTFQIPRGSTGASAASQSPENTNVSDTDEAWSNVSVNVVTIAGQQDVSRQSLERGTPGLDEIVYTDLVGAYSAQLDQQLINGSGSSGTHLGVLNTTGINAATAFGAVATAVNFQTKLAGQYSAISGSRFQPPTTIVMAPRRWGWMLSLSDSNGRPLVLPNSQGPFNAAAVGSAAEYGQVVGSWMNLPVIVDREHPTAVGTNSEDVVVMYRAPDILLWEEDAGTPRQLRFEQTLGNQLTVKLVIYGYTAFTAGRYPVSVGTVGGKDTAAGNGLIAPTNF